ncbi:HAMP domain-containing sensor histidine kinase [Paenibacillus aurantius]|uniref:histidine kinase n=1 Tax=Paenibacillus aurantius TaxID=2918900 RepID=A0AA96LFC5_9BACL|nr:HAMP domain-containing sensor histidine kinase [Paenibacillus aurantius]WNQ10592.1 HAMP domain-containing sensor histidine kinase [Paenibacillus aurantius]
MKAKQAGKVLAWVLAWILFLWGVWTAAYYAGNGITAWTGWSPSAYGRQLLSNGISLFLIFGSAMTAGHMTRPKQQRAFQPILDAFRRMSKGDFNISIENKAKGRNWFGDMVDSINTMAAELGELETMRQEFISNVSHEIQSPLTSIRGFARALQNPDLPLETRRHYLSIIETESSRLSRMSDHLLKLTSLESKHHPFEPKLYRLDRQLKSIILSLEPQWAEKGLEVEAELEEVTVTADEELMSQVWINLLHNSIKFTPPGGTLTVKAVRTRKEVSVVLTDTGIGLNEEEKEHIFERFYKADRSRSRAAGGSGLGLAIVKKIVDMHEGGIEVEGSPGEGTRFRITLPG